MTLAAHRRPEDAAGDGGELPCRGRRRSPSSCATGATPGATTASAHALWKQFAELGLTGICIPESHGGLGLGATEAALVLEEIGRNLTPSPFLTTAVVAARAIEGTAHGERWYPGILSGEAVLALAVDEGPRHAPERTALEAKRQGNGFVLNGAKQFVVHGNSADMIVTVARTGGSPGEREGLTLFAVPKGSAGWRSKTPRWSTARRRRG